MCVQHSLATAVEKKNVCVIFATAFTTYDILQHIHLYTMRLTPHRHIQEINGYISGFAEYNQYALCRLCLWLFPRMLTKKAKHTPAQEGRQESLAVILLPSKCT